MEGAIPSLYTKVQSIINLCYQAMLFILNIEYESMFGDNSLYFLFAVNFAQCFFCGKESYYISFITVFTASA